MDICDISGIFTVPVSGTWKMSYSLRSEVNSDEDNYCKIYINGNMLWETDYYTYSETGRVSSSGGRVVTMEASAGDKIEIRADRMDGFLYYILYCAEYIPKM